MTNNLERLYRRLEYQFQTPTLLEQALTHRSANSENNERFEFLGDSILSFVIANLLFRKFPLETEGKLSRLRSYLVKGETLAEVAQELDLGDFLNLGPGELRSGGHRRASILADTLEAVFAAIYLDSDLQTCEKIILRLYQARLEDKGLNEHLKDAKTQLQELLQAKQEQLPDYQLTRVTGQEHNQLFHASCFVAHLGITTEGCGHNRRQAEQKAASALLDIIHHK